MIRLWQGFLNNSHMYTAERVNCKTENVHVEVISLKLMSGCYLVQIFAHSFHINPSLIDLIVTFWRLLFRFEIHLGFALFSP